MNLTDARIVITGGAGLVGQNLLVKLADNCGDICVIDKSSHNLAIAEKLHPDVAFIDTDLAQEGCWQKNLAEADIVIMLHAQIGGNISEDFYRNNVTATENVLARIPRAARIVHVSSSVIQSSADDDYSVSKAQQEKLVVESGLRYSILRPTLMFGWFDRKHFGWLSHFLQSSPVFPIPGEGKFVRQPLYAGDFCEIILACMRGTAENQVWNISGKERVDYIDTIKMIKTANGANCLLLKLPYHFFYFLLAVYAVFDRDPPFTTSQLKALVIDETFEDIDWESIFNVSATPLAQAIHQTFADPVYSKIKLKF
ncbi:MAG: nucleoside-diphosphate-sugar epimerase [Halioglobus sp.]